MYRHVKCLKHPDVLGYLQIKQKKFYLCLTPYRHVPHPTPSEKGHPSRSYRNKINALGRKITYFAGVHISGVKFVYTGNTVY